MLLSDRISNRENGGQDPPLGRLPTSLKPDESPARLKVLKRLSESRRFALGGKSGVLKAFQRRSGRSFQLDARQRVIVKALVSRHLGMGAAKGAVLAKHVAYLGRPGAGADGQRAEFFDARNDGVDATGLSREWARDRHHFRFIVSPEHGDRIEDLRDYTRRVMARVSADLGEEGLQWVAVVHSDTDQPHAHVLVRGRRGDGRDLVIPRSYIGFGFRARAQEVAQELLGALSRVDAERRIWREAEADRFTSFDRRLIARADGDGRIFGGLGGSNTWSALLRGRLDHLVRLGLANREGADVRLDRNLEQKLRELQRSKDIIRTLNQRRLESGAIVRLAGQDTIKGRVVMTGYHDELGAQPFVVVSVADGTERYARLGLGQALPKVGQTLTVQPAVPIQQQGLGLRLGLGLGRDDIGR